MQHPASSNIYFLAQALISKAYALPESERDAFIARECENNGDLRQEVGWFLEVLRGPDDDFFLNEGPQINESALSRDLKVPTPRNYTLIRKLGEGGAGVVYQAERVDGEFRHVVALKMLNILALHDPIILARFSSERQILARLNHPFISHLVDAGALSDGRPFLAMEYIEGVRIDHYCSAHRISTRKCLELFLKVCAAVQYAHQQLIIHRDIKPANILVTAEGEPKLLDFGIARLMESPRAITQTAGVAMMTLAYASPEQIEGKPLSIATDEYSLGVTLYELLAGTHPWGTAGNAAEIVSAVSRSQPAAPSAALRSRRDEEDKSLKLRRGFWQRRRKDLPRDLDIIVLKAMSRDPQDRYPTVSAMADDITRFLEGRPLHARQMHAWYWARKFVARHKIGVLTALLGIVGTLGFAFDRQMQLEKTRAQRSRAEAVVELLTSMFKSADPTEAAHSEMSAREALDQAADRMTTHLQDQPETRAALLLALGNAYEGLSLGDQAKKAFDEALGLAQYNENLDPAQRVEILSRAGEFMQSILGNRRDSETLGRQAVAIARAELPAGDPVRTAALWRLSLILSDSKRNEGEVEAFAREAVAESRLDKTQVDAAQDADHALGVVLTNKGRLAEAEEIYRSLVQETELRLGFDSARVLILRNELARVMLSEGNYSEAEPIIRETLARAEKRYGPNSQQVAGSLNSLADLYNRTGRDAEAADAMTRAVDADIARRGKDNSALGQKVCNLAFALVGAKRLDEARTRAEECVRLRFLPQANLSGYYKGHAMYVLGTVKEAQQHLPEALDDFKRATSLLKEDSDRNGRSLYLAADKAIVDLAIVIRDIPTAKAYAADFESHIDNSDNAGFYRAKHAVLQAKIALALGDAAGLTKAERSAWESLRTAPADRCEAFVPELRGFIQKNTPPGTDPPVDLSISPCAQQPPAPKL
jgi:predicted Ser/Thr protein kinase